MAGENRPNAIDQVASADFYLNHRLYIAPLLLVNLGTVVKTGMATVMTISTKGMIITIFKRHKRH